MPRSVIPFLNRSGVSAISIGANGGSTPPDIPPCFLWEDSASGTSLLGLFTWPGYGSLPLPQQKTCVVEGLEHALVYNWNGDNAGPFEASEYESAWDQLRRNFPNAKEIVASTLDNFTQHLVEVRNKLPVVRAEVGDTWIYGVPSDPQKVSRMAAIEKVWGAAADLSDQSAADPRHREVFLNATRFALKLAEHTWGKDVKSNLKDNWSWRNADFNRAKGQGHPTPAVLKPWRFHGGSSAIGESP